MPTLHEIEVGIAVSREALQADAARVLADSKIMRRDRDALIALCRQSSSMMMKRAAELLAIEASIPDPSDPTPPGAMEDIGFIRAVNGEPIVHRNKIIRGIHGENNARVPLLDLDNCHVLPAPGQYGIYLMCDKAVLNKVTIVSDYYVARGSFGEWWSTDCVMTGKHALRLYNLTKGRSLRDRIDCARLMLGGGTAEEGPNQWAQKVYGRDATPQEKRDFPYAPFHNFTFDGSEITTDDPSDVFPNTHDVAWINCQFPGNGVSCWGGSHDLLFDGSLSQDRIKLGKDWDGQQAVTWANASDRGIICR